MVRERRRDGVELIRLAPPGLLACFPLTLVGAAGMTLRCTDILPPGSVPHRPVAAGGIAVAEVPYRDQKRRSFRRAALPLSLRK
jgi:hypothetical protein